MQSEFDKYKKPATLIMSEVRWKYLVRSVLKQKNILILGPTGCGKTFSAECASKVLGNRPFAKFNLGATQDPRSTLIGNTHLDKHNGTYFSQSYFVQMIQTPNAIILLDELSRANPEAWNILMTVLDTNQRYLRLDEDPNSPIIHVADGVCFIATANIGAEYTSVRVIDRAMFDRFATIIEMDPLSEEDEFALLKARTKNVSDDTLKVIAKIAAHTRKMIKDDSAQIRNFISTRISLEFAELTSDGLSLQDAAEVCVFPFFPDVGGAESERTYMRQLLQQYITPNTGAAAPDDSKTKPKPFMSK
jgi:MoxR-like ATPase